MDLLGKSNWPAGLLREDSSHKRASLARDRRSLTLLVGRTGTTRAKTRSCLTVASIRVGANGLIDETQVISPLLCSGA
jgi:hypothetical protein